MNKYIYVPGLSEEVEKELGKIAVDEKPPEPVSVSTTGARKKDRQWKDGDKVRHHKVDNRSISVPVCDKYALTIKEASEYYNIAESRLKDFIQANLSAPFVLRVGARLLVKRVMFEDFLNKSSSI